MEDILECIRNNPAAYANRVIHYNSKKIQKTHPEQQLENVHKEGAGAHTKTVNNTMEDTGSTQQNIKIVKTRDGRTIRKPDRLKYE